MDQVAIVCYTDPLCCWSWGLQPQLQRLLAEHPGISIEYRMGGLIPDWTSFSDPLNSIFKPAQMGPMWMQASHLTGRKIDDLIWVKDPPSSSYPACIAVKTAALQSAEAEALMLESLSEAVMTRCQNISKIKVLAAVAEKLGDTYPEVFDTARFRKDYNGTESREAFRQDLNEVKLQKVGRFPTLTITNGSQSGVRITGFRPYEALLEAINQVNP